MVLLIYLVFKITVGVSLLSFSFSVSVCSWCICTDIASTFISASFSASMRYDMPCFPGTTLACLIATSCHRLDSCSTMSCLNRKTLHTYCILIGIQKPSEECFPPIHILKAQLKNSSCRPDTAIDGPGPFREYTGCPNIVDDLYFMNFSTMDPLVLPRALSNMVVNYVSKLSIINASGGVSLPNFSFLCPGVTSFGTGFIPVPTTIVLSWVFNYFCGIGGT